MASELCSTGPMDNTSSLTVRKWDANPHRSATALSSLQSCYIPAMNSTRAPLSTNRNFYSCTIESILTGNITTWFGNSTMQDSLRALQRVVRSAERIIRTELPDLHSICSKRCWTKARKMVKDLSHPNNGLASCVRSGNQQQGAFVLNAILYQY
ncbi:uncharacterized protein Hap1MRO34_014955 isoform 1-T1 [Clarias gariepinus]